MDSNKKLTNKTASSEQVYQEIFNGLLDPVVIYLIDEHQNFIKFVQFNNAFINVYGYSKADIEDLTFFQISAEGGQTSEYIREISNGQRSLFETKHKKKSGETFPVEVHSHSIEFQGKLAIVSIIRIITLRKKAEDDLLALIKSKDNILKIVSHDLRNPLAQIQGLIQLIQMNDIPEPIQKYLTIMDESREHAENIVSELIASDELIGGETKLNCNKINIYDFCRKIVNHYEVFTKSKKQIEFISSLPEKNAHIQADEKKLTRVFDNIISNAVKFSNPNSSIAFQVLVSENEVTFSIKDDGIGIPNELKNLIFDQQTKAKRTGTLGEKTIGLGMSIAKSIVEQHDGKIWFESKEEKGSTFFVSIPLSQNDYKDA